MHVFEASKGMMHFAPMVAKACGGAVRKIEFRLLDAKDGNERLLRSVVEHDDFLPIASRMREGWLRQHSSGRLAGYLFGVFSTESVHGSATFTRAALLIRLARWHAEKRPVILFLNRRPWLSAFGEFAAKHGVEIRPAGFGFSFAWKRFWMIRAHRKWKNFLWRLRRGFQPVSGKTGLLKEAKGPKVLVECHYHVHLNRPEIFSELFFWPSSQIPGKDFVVTFHVPRDPLDREKFSELREHGFFPLPLRAEATRVAECPPFDPAGIFFRSKNGDRPAALPKMEKRWCRLQTRRYAVAREYWARLFKRFDCRLYLSWYKYAPEHCAIADAMEALGGVTALYQRALEANPAACTAVDVDLFFGFSKFSAEIERRSHSRIPYFVITGFLGDHRFLLLKPEAEKLRAKLMQNGAKKIVAFTDENSHDDERWLLGHTVTRSNYRFLLEKVLEEPWLGLVLKPKIPATLFQRLGPVAELLSKALATGRCHLFEEGACHSSYPPAVAALAADIAVHGHFSGPTAAFEAALTGRPSLMIDQEGLAESPLHALGEGKVIFREWPSLWELCLEHWKRPVPSFGDWSPLLDDLDPFRDGRGAERMGGFIHDLFGKLKSGEERKQALAFSAERYAKKWGSDKIVSI